MTLLNIISILLTLGTSPDCDGFGMCIVEQHTESAAENCLKYDNCIQAELRYAPQDLELIVSHKHMKDNLYIKHFTTEQFRMDRDYRVPEDVCTAVGCPIGTVIPAGKYPIYEEGGKIVVRIQL